MVIFAIIIPFCSEKLALFSSRVYYVEHSIDSSLLDVFTMELGRQLFAVPYATKATWMILELMVVLYTLVSVVYYAYIVEYVPPDTKQC